MRIQHNIMAMNAYRNYNTNTSALSKNLEKLSSGYKINRAGDDAAGLAISEKMRAQITGLNAAQKNVKDGISLVKTAEGAMQEIQDMLNRMDYLATQSANGTYQNEVDRENLQKEVTALKDEINRIADSANFNGIKLLDGSLEHVAATSSTTSTVTVGGKNVNGVDRMLNSDLDPTQDKAYEQVGIKNIYDSTGPAATAGKFMVDLSGLTFSKNGSASVTAGTFTLKIGSNTYTCASVTVAANASAGAVKTAILGKLKQMITGSAAGTSVTINNSKWTVTVATAAGTITFEQKEAPTKASQAQTDFKVAVSWDSKVTGSNATDLISSSHLGGTIVLKEAVAKDADTKANTVFKLEQDDFVDGAKITVAGKEITLRVGKESKIASGAGTVNLTDMEYGKIDLDTALSRISKALGSKVTVQDADGKNGTFKIGVSDDGQGIAIAHSSGSGVWADKEALGKLFSLNIAATTMTVTTPGKVETGTGLTLQIGDTADTFNQLKVGIGDMHVDGMGIDGVDISTINGAQTAIGTIKDAINYVSSIRGDLGAVQNRLEHTANNLSVMAENIQDAESTIRDTDVAEEMMAYTKNNILIQSAQAMLAQANAVPQGVLQLLG